MPKLYLSAEDLGRMETAMLPANLVPTRDIFLFCCYTGLRYSDVSGLHRGNLHEWQGARVLLLINTVLWWVCYRVLRSGWRLKA